LDDGQGMVYFSHFSWTWCARILDLNASMSQLSYGWMIGSLLGLCSGKDLLPVRVSPPALCAPEMILGARYDTKLDIWALGCLVSDVLE
jgi:serine/threonine protein kinase